MAASVVPIVGNSIGEACIIVESISQAAAFISVGLRIWARRFKKQKLQSHDYLVIVGLFFSVGITVVHFISVILGGLGLPSDEISPENLVLNLKLIPPPLAFWSVGNTAIKLSFLTFFKSVFSLEQYRARFLAVGTVCVALGVAAFVETLAICEPFEYQWDKTIEGGHCGQQYLGILLIAVFNMITDFLVFALPVPIIWSIRAPSRRRKELVLIFCMGIFVTCFTVLRVALTGVVINDVTDQTYWLGILVILLQLEVCVGIVASCVPIWAPLLRKKTRNHFREGSRGPDEYSRGVRRVAESYLRLTDVTPRHRHTDDVMMETRVKGGDDSGEEGRLKDMLGSESGITVTTQVEVRHDDQIQAGQAL